MFQSRLNIWTGVRGEAQSPMCFRRDQLHRFSCSTGLDTTTFSISDQFQIVQLFPSMKSSSILFTFCALTCFPLSVHYSSVCYILSQWSKINEFYRVVNVYMCWYCMGSCGTQRAHVNLGEIILFIIVVLVLLEKIKTPKC